MAHTTEKQLAGLIMDANLPKRQAVEIERLTAALNEIQELDAFNDLIDAKLIAGVALMSGTPPTQKE